MARLPSNCFQLPLADCGASSTFGACGRRTVAITAASSRNIAASMANSSVNEDTRVVSTRCPPISPPTPSPRF